jgi:hypothetical protein
MMLAWLGSSAALLGWRVPATQLRVFLGRPQMSRSAGGAYATSDCYLAALHIPRPSEAVLAAVADLPPDEGILFIGPADAPSFDLTVLVVSYLSWPRQIFSLKCGERQLPPPGGTVRHVMFYMTGPPGRMAAGQKRIGPNLSLVTAAEVAPWTSYCSF